LPLAAIRGKRSPEAKSTRATPMDKQEILKLREHLRRSLGAYGVNVTQNSREKDSADVTLGEAKIGTLLADEEDGDRSFFFEMKVPVERAALQSYLRKLFENDKLTIMARTKKTDSVELNNGPDFLGVITADDAKGKSYTLEMAILDCDLEDL
jgi:hypothetical protein